VSSLEGAHVYLRILFAACVLVQHDAHVVLPLSFEDQSTLLATVSADSHKPSSTVGASAHTSAAHVSHRHVSFAASAAPAAEGEGRGLSSKLYFIYQQSTQYLTNVFFLLSFAACTCMAA
jgi:hypothetical protein